MFNDIYISAFETILFVETVFGTELRDHAIRISKERYALRQEITHSSFQSASDLRPDHETSPRERDPQRPDRDLSAEEP